MDSIKKIISQEQPNMPTSLSFLDNEELFPCPHGTMVPKVKDGRLMLSCCPECTAGHEEKAAKYKARKEKEARFGGVMWNDFDAMAIPKRFKGKTLENYSAKTKLQKEILLVCEKFSSNFDSVLDRGTSLVFCGKPGTGKTHLCYAIVSFLRESFVVAVIKTAADMTAEVKEAYKSETTTPTEVVSKYTKYDLLVIDEVGVQVSSEAEKRIFFDVINKRYENMLPTIMISNLELNELSKFTGERVMDRMRENGGSVFAFDWESFRR